MQDYYKRKMVAAQERLDQLIQNSAGLEGVEFEKSLAKVNQLQTEIKNYKGAIK